MTHLIEGFKRNYKVVHADNRELIAQSFALRYQVYCVERAYEAPVCPSVGKEFDEYDARSVHSLVYHRELDRYIGSVRLILDEPQAPTAPFPIETLCKGLRKVRLQLSDEESALRVAEISRFAISKQRRTGTPEKTGVKGVVGRSQSLSPSADSGILPHATLGLFAAIVRMSAAKGITHWYALMEPTLLRLLSRFGIYFSSVGPLVEHRGRRRPVLGEIDWILTRIFVERPDVWELITDAGWTWPLNGALLSQMRKEDAMKSVSNRRQTPVAVSGAGASHLTGKALQGANIIPARRIRAAAV